MLTGSTPFQNMDMSLWYGLRETCRSRRMQDQEDLVEVERFE